MRNTGKTVNDAYVFEKLKLHLYVNHELMF